MKALPRLTDVNGELVLKVYSDGVDHDYPVSIGSVANLAQDCVDAMARRARKMDGKEPTR